MTTYNPAPLVRHVERNGHGTQKRVARAAGVSQQTMVKLVTPPTDYVPSMRTVVAVAAAIGAAPMEFWR